MAATVVSVVIFLLGVFVGRGVRAERGTVADSATASAAVAETSPTPQPATAVPAPLPAGSDPTAAAPPKEAAEDLSYFKRLDKATPPAEKLKPAPKPAPKEDTVEPPPPPAPASAGEPTGQGYVVQIAALNVRSDAEAIAKRLSNKGYAAYVVAPPDGTPAVYRVRVGKFPTKREADSVAAKLQKEEQFKPWVTR